MPQDQSDLRVGGIRVERGTESPVPVLFFKCLFRLIAAGFPIAFPGRRDLRAERRCTVEKESRLDLFQLVLGLLVFPFPDQPVDPLCAVF